MTHSHLMQSEQTVWVSALASNVRSTRPQLRMDGQNGLHKIMWLSKGHARVMINGITKGFGPNTFVYVPGNIPHVFEVGFNSYGTFIAIDPKASVSVPPVPFNFAILNIMKQAETAKYVDSIVSEATSEEPGRFTAVEAYTSLLLLHILRLTGDSIEKKRNGAPKTNAEVFSHLRKPISFREYIK